jgi:hypothetical protein
VIGRPYQRDRQRLAYAFAIAAIVIGSFLAITRTLDQPGAYIVIGGFVSASLLMLGVPVNPKDYFDDPARDRRRSSADDSGEVPRVERPPGQRDERTLAHLASCLDFLSRDVRIRRVQTAQAR